MKHAIKYYASLPDDVVRPENASGQKIPGLCIYTYLKFEAVMEDDIDVSELALKMELFEIFTEEEIEDLLADSQELYDLWASAGF